VASHAVKYNDSHDPHRLKTEESDRQTARQKLRKAEGLRIKNRKGEGKIKQK
jgi:hypothetical protein